MSVLDAESLELLTEIPLEGFLRLSNAGDGRHLAVSAAGGFHVLDTGSWSEAHGHHAHHYTVDPALTGGLVDAGKPGHVVAGAGRTAFFDDAAGTVDLVDTRSLGEEQLAAERIQLAEAHHGVAVPLEDGRVFVSLGSETGQDGAAVLAGDGSEVLRSDECPGLHGEAGAAGAVVFGCEDGMLVYRDGGFVKVPSPDGYGRMGNQAGSPGSSVVLADYKTAPGAALERPQTVALVDTAAARLRLVELGTSYSFRSLGRGPAGEAVVLGTDGALHVLDPGTGAVTSRIEVIDPWEEPGDWQAPRPALHVLNGTAFVTDPGGSRVLAVDLGQGKVVRTAELARIPNEIASAG
ncbi:hypothetical protein ACWGQ2_09735 [Arthrobacter sp. NPDC055585]